MDEFSHTSGLPHTIRLRKPEDFEGIYTSRPQWDIGRPQSSFVALAQRGALRGRLLDVGCGTGEHAMMAAHLKLNATGVDTSATAIAIAERKARERGLVVRFLVWNALEIASLAEHFDTVLDCGLFHIFDDQERCLFVDNLNAIVEPGGQYFMLCFSDRQEGNIGPRRLTQDEIRGSFQDGWRIDSIEPAKLEVNRRPEGAHAWLASMTRI